MWVLNVTITKAGNFISKGAPVAPAIPMALGFYGYGIEKYSARYVQKDIDTVIGYLKG